MCVQTGEVKTNMTATGGGNDLEEEAFGPYASLRKTAVERQAVSSKLGVSAEAYAKDVVEKLLSRESWWRNRWVLWAGGQVTAMRVIQWIASNSSWDVWGFVMRKTYKLD